MASIYREGKGWAVRVRTSLHRRYKSGFRTHAEAREWARETESAVAKTKQPKGLGPQQTTLAMALRMYAEDFSVKKKGCVQEVVRINRFLALAQLPRLRAVRKRVDTGGDTPRWSFTLEERPASHAHPLPRPFETHRQARLAARPRSTAARQRLATLPVARIAAYEVNELVKAMLAEGNAPATIRIELALLSALFKTTEVWEWGKLPNVAHAVRWPSARGSARDRTLSADEEQRLAAALLDCRNRLVAPFVWFAIETAVRKSEGLFIARWKDLDESRRTLKLVEAKTGPRKVPLTRAALAILQALPGGRPDERIFPLSPDALDAAWARACQRAGIENLHIHDLRHTAATRYAKRLHGDIFLLQLITGHRSLSQLRRYVNPTVDDVVRALDATEAAG